MTQEVKGAFTRRIAQANRSEIIVILYEIFFTYMDEARTALSGDEDHEAANEALRRASEVLEHLKNALDFKYELAGQLFPLYVFAQKQIARAMYLADAKRLAEIEDLMRPLQEAFVEVAAKDGTATVMKNTEKVVAGYTYGRGDVNEAMADYDRSRGFFA